MTSTSILSFLPGQLLLARGTPRDYAELERFHYRPGRPATWAGVWSIRYVEPDHGRLVAVAVLSYPTVNSGARDRALGLTAWPKTRKLAHVNRHVRTISRVVVHPQFRGVGLASHLVRTLCRECPTRWVEAFAVMGRVNPFFEKGGMTRTASPAPDAPVYYLFAHEPTRK